MARSRLERWLKNRWIQNGLLLILAALITALLSPFKLEVMEFVAYDLRMRFTPRPSPTGQVILIPIEHETLKTLKREPEAIDWAVVLQKIGHSKPAQVVSFVNPSQILGSFEDLSVLSEVASRIPFVFGENDLPKTGITKLDPLAPPFEKIGILPAPKTVDRNMLAKDGATRRLILSFEGQFTMHPLIAQKFNHRESPEDYDGIMKLVESQQLLIQYRRKGAYTKINFIDLLNGNFDPEVFKNKIVLIGKDTQEAGADYVTTPLDKELLALSALEMHANVIDTLIKNEAPRLTPDWLKLVFTFLIALATIFIVLSVRPAKGLFVLALSMGAFLIVALVSFAAFKWVIPVAHPLMAVFICYYFVIPYRLIIENRKSWEYYQKNRLLTQVEELKSNFMRMMSHDLQTPLARIQGMTELIQKEAHSLTESQARALETIAESSQGLTEFIGSILSLSRIESKEMKLQLRSRDVNQIIRSVIKKVEYLAKRKRIEIVLELEPMFSIKVDEDLLKTVFTNLFENAIKYSDEDTKILITTEETDKEVIIQVADQGRGIPHEDLGRIFDRFYRARNNRSTTQGTGLGLFLAKYFVELHEGSIEVESQLERGSTFIVRLPMNLSNEYEPQERDLQGGLNV